MSNLPIHIDGHVRGVCVAGTSATTLISNSGTGNYEIELVTICNTTAGNRTLTLQINTGDTVAELLHEVTAEAGETVNLMELIRPGSEPLILAAGDSLECVADAADAVHCYAMGGEYS